MTRLKFLLMTIIIAGAGVPASANACRGPFDVLLFEQAPGPMAQAPFPTVVEAKVTGEVSAFASDPRGLLVGTAIVKRVVKGPALPPTIPVYVGVVTSCSAFWGGASYPFTANGFLVGRLVSDKRGQYLMAAEHKDDYSGE